MKLFSSTISAPLLAALVLATSGCQTMGSSADSEALVKAPATPVFVNQGATSGDYKIGVDDIVKVSVWKNDDLTVQVPVRPDGKISVPLIGDVAVGGKTPQAVSALITEELSTFLRDPQVTVILADLRSHEFLSRVRITGAVERPTSMPFRPGMTVLDAILEAGGVTKFANANSTKLYRKASTTADGEMRGVKLNRILKKGDLGTNYDLAPGDVITVPERLF